MTPAWGGVELSEEQQGEANRLLHKVTVRLGTRRRRLAGAPSNLGTKGV